MAKGQVGNEVFFLLCVSHLALYSSHGKKKLHAAQSFFRLTMQLFLVEGGIKQEVEGKEDTEWISGRQIKFGLSLFLRSLPSSSSGGL